MAILLVYGLVNSTLSVFEIRWTHETRIGNVCFKLRK